MDETVSIVIPIYNVEKYIHRCVSSILEQTYSNLEIILVDDGSPDNCPQICDNYAMLDTRVKVIHKKNGGLSDARNAGLGQATGKYIVFIDSDDYVEVNMIEKALNVARTHNIDTVIWGYYADFVDDHEKLIKTVLNVQSYNIYNKDQLSNIKINNDFIGLLGYAWNKMYRVDLLRNNNLQFTKGLSLVEDIVFNSTALSISEKIAFLEEPYSHYMQRPRVTLGTKFYDNYFDLKLKALYSVRALLVAWNQTNDNIDEIVASIGFRSLKSTIIMICSARNLTYEEKIEKLNEVFNNPETREIIKTRNSLSIKDGLIRRLIQLKQSNLLLFLQERLQKDKS